MSRLILTERGTFLGKTGEQFKILRKEKKDETKPAINIDQIVIIGRSISISSDAVHLANDNNIDILFLSYSGKPIARLIPARMGGTVKTRREQYLAYHDERSVHLAKRFVYGKMKNEASLLKSFAKKWKESKTDLWREFRESADKITSILEELNTIHGNNIEEVRERIMGIEGMGAEIYWSTYSRLIPEEWNFEGRDYPAAGDPINAMLNFGYYILEQEVWKAVLYAGLDPYAGFLHADKPGKEKIVYDLMEEFRPVVVDRVVVGLSNRMKPTHFVKRERMEMTEDGIKIALKEFFGRLDEAIGYSGRRYAIKNIIRSQASRVVTYLRGEREEYEPFTPRW
ncbi:MAG: CRISPR-associated endonuclease Cas1 [Candidatus Syntropharchaeia archaeon]